MSTSTERSGAPPPSPRGWSREARPGAPAGPGPAGPETPPGGTPPPGGELRAFATDLVRHVRQRWNLSLACAGGTVMLTAIFTLLQTPVYEAASTLLIKSLGREFVYRAEVGDQTFMPRDREALIKSEIEILRSQDVVLSVISAMGVERLYPSLAESSIPEERLLSKAVRSFSGNLGAQAVRDTDVIRVAFQHPDPQVAADTVNLLVESFKEKHLEAFSEPETADFLEDKVASYREKLQASEERLKSFQAEHEAFALADPDAYLLQQRAELKHRLRETQAQMSTVRQQYAQEDPAIAKGKMRLLELQLREQDLKAGIGGTSRDLQDVREKIGLVKKFLARRQAEVGELEKRELELLEEQRADTEERLAHMEKELKGLSKLSTQFRELTRELEVNERNYGTFAAKAEEARLSDEMDREKIANISVIQRATAPLDPVRPRPLLNLAAGLMVGGALGLVVPYVAASFSSKTA